MYLSCLRRSLGMLAVLCLAAAAVALPGQAQEPYTIQGRVVDATTQQPLSNVSVMLRGTQIGTLTNNEGRFNLIARVQPGAHTLRFSLIGRGEATRAITLGAERTVQVGEVGLQASAVQLEEIIVTGTGVPTERRALGNTVASVAGEEVNQAPGAQSVDKALQGKIPGAVISQNNGQPGGGVSIRLRGTSSILGGAEPLVVIDGVIVDNNSTALVGLGANATYSGAALTNALSDIAPADIERVEVIKGAAAAALYGSRANNGVIQIFTRRGQQGRPQITFRSELSTSEAANRYQLNESPVAGQGDVVFGGASAIGVPVTRYLYQDQIFQRGNAVTNNLAVSGGTEGTTYHASANWRNESGIVRGTGLSNVNVRGSVGQRLADWIDITLSGNYIQRNGNYMPEGEQTQGVITTLIFTPTTWDPGFDPNIGRYRYNPLIGTNPFDVMENWRAEQDVNRFVGSFAANATPLRNVTVNYVFGFDRGSEHFTYFIPVRATSATFPGSIQNPVRDVQRFNNDLTATHDFELNPAVRATTTLGFRQTVDHTNIVRAAASDLPPGQTTVGGATQSASQFISELRTIGGFVQERLGFRNRVFLTGALNWDASSAFGENERWQFFPRVGASWVLHEEPFWTRFPAQNVLSSLRVRASYGETGGQPPTVYDRFDNYNNVARGGRAGLTPSATAGNPGLRPERQREYEGGFELGLFADRASVDFTYYDQLTSDLVLRVPLPRSSGYDTQFRNVGELSNKGIELGINTINVDRPGLNWTSRLSFGRNRERVERLTTETDTLQFGYFNFVMVGQPVGVFYATYYPRDAQGNIIFGGARTANGTPIAGTQGVIPGRARGANPVTGDSTVFLRKILGSPVPDFTLALNNDFTIAENVSVSFLLDGRFGNEVANFSRRISEYFGAGRLNETEQCVEAVNPANNRLTTYCPYTLNPERHLNYEEFIEDGSFVKLREAAIRYQLPTAMARRFGAGGLSVNLTGRNLHTWTNYTGIDPEVNLFSANTVARGTEFGTSPIPRTFSVGITANF
jgi:TonB-dependent starch-binding outer membrane protein SusC